MMKADQALKRMQATRRRNLAVLAEKAGGAGHLSVKLDYTNQSVVSVLLSGKRTFTEKTARRIEEKLRLAAGWLDVSHIGEKK